MGGDTEVQSPQVPAAPSYSSTIQDYIQNYPDLFNLQQQYAPQEAALQQNINQELYPETAGLQESLAGQASQGMSEVPAWYQANTQDMLKSQFGRNVVYNPQGQEQFGIATNQANEDWKRYYQNMALSVAGRQPLASYSNNITSQYAPSQATQYAAGNYGTSSSLYGNMYNANAQMAMQPNPWASALGSIGGMAAGGMAGGMFGYGGKFGQKI